MSVIFENYQCSTTFKSQPLITGWHKNFPRLAVATQNGVVTIYNEEGERINAGVVSRTTNCTAFYWHPTLPCLVTGWKDGNLTVFDENGLKNANEIKENPHDSIITVVKFASDGLRFCTADKKGLLCIWEYQSSDRVILLEVHETNVGEITNAESKVISGEKNSENEREYIYIVSNAEGKVFLADEVSHFKEILNLGSPIKVFLHYELLQRFVFLTEDSILYVYEINNELEIIKKMKEKINACREGDTTNLQGIKIGEKLMATCSNEKVIRFWNIENEENFSIRPTENVSGNIISMSFNSIKRVICGIDGEGVMTLWQFIGSFGKLKGYDDWDCFMTYKTDVMTTKLAYGPGEDLISYVSSESVFIMQEYSLQRKLRGKFLCVQLDSSSLLLEDIDDDDKKVSFGKEKLSIPINCSINIKKIDLIDTNIIITNGKRVDIFEVKNGMVRLKEPIKENVTDLALHSEGIFLASPKGNVDIYNMDGTKKQTIVLSESEGKPKLIDIRSDYVAVCTDKNFLLLYHMSGRMAKRIGMPFKLFRNKNDGHEYSISSMKINRSGNRISLIVKEIKSGVHVSSSKLLIYDVNKNKVFSHDFVDKYPVSHYWDEMEPKLIVVETKKFFLNEKKKNLFGMMTKNENDDKEGGEMEKKESIALLKKEENDNKGALEICTLFATQFHGIKLQDTFKLDSKYASVVGSCVPYFYYVLKDKDTSRKGNVVEKRSMRDFEGIEIKDNSTREALMNFSYYLAIGNMEEAYKSVKMINDKSVWHNMAKMCVKNKKMDVAEICLSNMQNAIGSKALREAKKEEELEARVAMLAIHLGMIGEAEKLYKECKRFDLLNKLYQSIDEWEKALEVAEKYDRIHLQTTHYQYARHLESMSKYKLAIKHYELSNNHHYEVPRMFLESDNIIQLQSYISNSNNPKLFRWWANYCEGNNNTKSAIQFYIRSKDFLALVRIKCHFGHFKQAGEIVMKSNCKAASFHLAKQYEEKGNNEEALRFYKIAGNSSHAIRLAQKCNMSQVVFNLSMESESISDIMGAAEYFEKIKQFDKAVLLFRKGGFVSKAIDICFVKNLDNSLIEIVSSLDDKTDPAVFRKCGSYFMKNGKFDKALYMFIKSNEYAKAIDLFENQKIRITKEVADKISIPRMKDPKEQRARKEILLKIARICESQGLFNVASKKYLQAGDKEMAMKAIIRSGKTQTIIGFAKNSKKKKLYVLAANYLQTLNWGSNKEIMNNIVRFYKKARAFGKLSAFYYMCARQEIDDFNNLERGKQALEEALKWLSKEKNVPTTRTLFLKNSITYVSTFLKLSNQKRNMEIGTARRLLEKIDELDNTSEGAPIKIGSVFALIINFYHNSGDKKLAFKYAKAFVEKNLDISKYMNEKVIKDIYKENGMKYEIEDNGGFGGLGDQINNEVINHEGGGIEEEIDFEEIYENN